jgi:hypothetical protein
MACILRILYDNYYTDDEVNTYPSLNNRLSLLSLCAVFALGGCASTNDEQVKSAGVGAAIGCAAGAVVAALADSDAGAGCAAAGLIGGIAGYVYARNAELEEGKLLSDAATGVDGVHVSPIQTDKVRVVDSLADKTNIVEAFKLVSVDIPVNQIGTKEGQEIIRKLRIYARKVAAQRGESVDMITAVAPNDEATTGVTQSETVETVGKGSVRQVRVTDPSVSPRVHRVTIEAKNPSSVEV